MVSQVDRVLIFDCNTYKQTGVLWIKLKESRTREPNQIIGMSLSKCQQYLGVITGKNLIMDE